MARQKFHFVVKTIVEVELDTDKFDADFLAEFSTSIRNVHTVGEVAEHIAFCFAHNGDYDFIEGVGDLIEMEVNLSELDVEVEPFDWQEAA